MRTTYVAPIDPLIVKSLVRGCFHPFIPVDPNMTLTVPPREELSFECDAQTKADLLAAWQIAPTRDGAPEP